MKYWKILNGREIDLGQTVSVTAKHMPVSEVLDRLLEKTDLSYAMEGVNIILSKKHAAEVAQQREKTVTGTILDEKGESVIGANITVKGSSNGTITDIDGSFSLNAGSGDILQISYMGYISQEIAVASQTNVRITL